MSEAKKKTFDKPYQKLFRITSRQVSCGPGPSSYHFGLWAADIHRQAADVMQRMDRIIYMGLINGR